MSTYWFFNLSQKSSFELVIEIVNILGKASIAILGDFAIVSHKSKLLLNQNKIMERTIEETSITSYSKNP